MSVALWFVRMIGRILGFGGGLAVNGTKVAIQTGARMGPELIRASKDAYVTGANLDSAKLLAYIEELGKDPNDPGDVI